MTSSRPRPCPSPRPSDSALEIRRLHITAGDRCIIEGARLRVGHGEVVALTGPSGVGKSTLLRAINRLLELRPGMTTNADIHLGSLDVYAPDTDPDVVRRRVGFLFQRPVVFPKSIRTNLTLALGPSGVPRRLWGERVESSLCRAALWSEVAERLGEDATHLSLGQQQRLCLARALIVEPDVLLLDEPTSALDATATAALERGLMELSGDLSILLVTHDAAQAERLAHRQLRLIPGPAGATVDDPRMDSYAAVIPVSGSPLPQET